MITLSFPVQISLKKAIDYKVSIAELGEGYTQTTANRDRRAIKWQGVSGFLSITAKNALIQQLQDLKENSFEWYPTPRHTEPIVAVCLGWSEIQISVKSWVLDFEFEQKNVGNCIELDFNLDISGIGTKLTAAWNFISTYTRDTLPNFANSNRMPLNDFMSKPGRRNYFPKECGTTEALYLIATAVLKLSQRFKAKGNTSLATTQYNYARDMVNYAITRLYRTDVPTNPIAQIWLPHWLYTGRGQAEIKGTTVTPNFLNSGVFNANITFTNGIGTLPATLANTYRVHDGELLWQFVDSPLITGTNYPIDWYIDKYNVKISGNGDNFTNDTGQTAGKIKLVSNFTGTLKVVYSVYTGNFVPNNTPIEAFPMWRATLTGTDDERNHAFDVSFWANETYKLLKSETSLQSEKDRWQRAIDANNYSTLQAAIVKNESFVFKIDTTTTDPASYVGVQLIRINGKLATLTRLATGEYQITQQSSAANTYGQCELQNFAVYAIWGRDTFWQCNFRSNTAGILYWGVSTSDNPGDTSQMYYYPFLLAANTTYNRQFNNLDFLKWGIKTHWHSTNADTAISTYQGSGGSSVASYQMESIDGRDRLIAKLNLSKGSGFAGGVLGLLENRPRLPLPIYMRCSGSIILKIRDGSNNNFTQSMTSLQWGIFSLEVSNLVADGHTNSFNQNEPITQIEVITNGVGEIAIWYIGKIGDYLPYNSYVYKHLVANRQANAATWVIGNCEVKNSSLNDLPYNPAVVPFTANFVGTTRVSWTGSPLVGYQDENYYWTIGRNDLASDVVKFKLASQNSYAGLSATGANWVFRATFNWARWDSSSPPPYNAFIDTSPDPNYAWEGYTHRAIESTAEYWRYSQNPEAGIVVMRFLRGLYGWITNRIQNNLPIRPPTDYVAPLQGLPTSLYDTPHGAVLIMRTAIDANMAGGDPLITCSIIKWMYQYLESQYIATGNMAGTWSGNQPTFTQSSQQYREWFPFWQAEIILGYLLLEEDFAKLNIPVC